MLSNGNVAISTNNNSVVDGTTINRGDVAEITTGGTFVQFLFDGNTQFTPAGANIDAVWVNESNGNIVLSTTGTASLPGLANFQDEDIVEFDGATAVMLFDGSVHITGGNVDKDVDAVHVLDDDNLFVSLQRNHSVAGVSFRDGDVILVENPSAVSPTASLHMTEFVYTGNDDTDAISFEVDATPVLDHFDLMFVAAGSTCLPSEIVIEAKDAGGTTITTYTGTVTLSTSTGNGDWTAPGTTSDPAQGTFTPGAADSGNATYTFVAGDAGDIAILLANEHAETLTMTVDDAGAAVTSVSGNLTFSDNVFVITPTTSGGDNVVAGRDHVFHIEMIRSAPPACGVATGYNNPAQTLKAWIVRDVDDPGGGLPTLAEQTAALGEGAPPAADNLQLDFLTVPGESDFTLQTTDVGKFVLNIRDDTNGFAAVDIDGATNTLTVRPFGYDVQVTGNPAASGPGGSGFVSAGTAFAVTVTAVVWESADDDGVPIGTADDGIPDGHESGDSDPSNNVDLSNNPATPAYGQEPAIEVVGLSALLDQPGGGNDPGLSGGTSIAGFVAGVGSTATAQYDEVGIVEIRGVLTGDGVYLGGQAVQGASGFVGRFFPDHFELDLTDAGFGFTNRSDLACASRFTYMDENFSVDNYQIIARSVGGGSTQNYEGAFANLALPGDINFGAVDVGAIDLTTRLSVSSFSGSFSLGVALIDTVFSLGRDAPNIDGPFDAFNVGVAPEDTVDSVTLQTFDLDVDIDTIDDHATLGATVQRFGRLFIEPTFGSEIATLPVPMHTELFDGSSFVINADDNCTPFAVTDLILSNNIEVNQTDGDIIIVGVATTTATIVNNPVSAGDTDLSFSRPGAGNVGFTDVTTDLATLGSPYLFYDWDSDGVFDNDPVARVTFGIFQGPSVIIYRREPGVFQ